MANGMRDIANTLDVAVSTVSRALSGKPGVSEALRIRIRKMAEAQHVMPDPQAQALRSGKGAGLTIITRMWEFRINAMFNQFLFDRGREAFGSVRVHSVMRGESLDRALRNVLAFRPATVIVPYIDQKITKATVKRIRDQGVAIIGLNWTHPSFDAVCCDYLPGMKQVVKRFMDSGCQTPVYMSGADLDRPDSRLAGIIAAYKDLDLPVDKIHLHRLQSHHIPLTHQKGYAEAKQVLDKYNADGLFCFNDEMAIGALHALAEAGIDVPQQMKVIGFDNIPETAYARVPLTTVNNPIEEMAKAAIRLCCRRLEDPTAAPLIERIPTSLVTRQSAPNIET